MRYRLLLLAAFILPAVSRAQQTISGVARDADTGTLLPCIDVWLRGASDSSSRVARTRTDGSFSFVTAPRDSATLQFFTFGARAADMPVHGLVRGVDHTAEYRLSLSVAVSVDGVRQPRKESTVGVLPPEPIPYNSQPRYPYSGDRRENASIVLRWVVDSTGRVRDKPLEALIGTRKLEFVDAIRFWLTRTRFKPATYDGVPRCAMMTMHFNFMLAQSQ